MLECRGLTTHYGRICALESVDLDVGNGEIVCLLGSNGAGKSTLLGSISASIPARVRGSVRFEGEKISGARADAIVRKGIALVPEGRQLFGEFSVEENLRVGAYLRRDMATIAADLERVYAMFPRLKERRAQIAQTLSGGEQQMVAIGRALMSRPRLLMLDEPSLGLAPIVVREIMTLIRRINRDGVSILLVEQNVRQALQIADRAYLLEKGTIVATGRAASLIGDPRLFSAYLGQGRRSGRPSDFPPSRSLEI